MDAISFFQQLTTEQLTERIRQLDGERAAVVQLLKAKRREEAIVGKRRSRPEEQRRCSQ